jgi:hypothetical protein
VNLAQFKGERILGGSTTMFSILPINKSNTDAYGNNYTGIVKVYVDVVNMKSVGMVKILP